jgi:protein O-GlcNAc transferase
MNHNQSIHAAFEYYQAGDIQQAEHICKQIIQQHSNNFDALHFLGIICNHLEKYDLALTYFQQAIQLDSNNAYAYFHLGNTWKEKGQIDEAISCYEKAIELSPQYSAAYNNLGNLFYKKGEVDKAFEYFQKAIEAEPDSATAYYNMANMLLEQDKIIESIPYYQNAIDLNPDFADAYYNLGFVFSRTENHNEAIKYYRKALQLSPDSPELYNRLGNALRQTKQLDEALKCYQKTIQIDPYFSVAYYNMGVTLWAQDKSDEAISAYNKAIECEPSFIKAHWAKCMSQLKIIYPDVLSIRITRQRYHEELLQLQNTLTLITPQDIENAVEAVGSLQPFYLPCQGLNNRELQQLHGDLVCKIMGLKYPQFSERPAMPPLTPGEPLRIGIVSRFFYWHSVWKIPIKGIIENIDKKRFNLYGYSIGKIRDHATEIAKEHLYRFVEDIYSFEKLCQLIKKDNLHVLIYPEIGMDPMTLKLASLFLAPIQCTTLGHPDTTGLPTIDYFLSSKLMEPDNADTHYTEKLIRLPNLSAFYTPFDASPSDADRDDFKLPSNSILYLCSHALFTHLPQYDQIYPRIAMQVPHCKFLFISDSISSITDLFRLRLKESFEHYNLVADDNLIFLPRLDQDQYYAINCLSDIFLDTIGWSANNSTFEAIACNLPVVTLPGNLMRQRHCSAILTMMDLSDTIAGSVDEYIEIAVKLGKDSEWRHYISEKISMNKHRIYRDKSSITALEDLLENVVKEKYD